MIVEYARSGSLVDVLDRVLDKGIVVDAWVRVGVMGIDLVGIDARVVVASIDTYLKYAEVLESATSLASLSWQPSRHGQPDNEFP